MPEVKTTKWDTSEYLDSPEHIAGYLAACFEEGDPALIVHALGEVVRTKGMSDITERSGVSRTSLYKALSDDARPEFATVMKVVAALGVQLHASATPTRPKVTPKARRRAAEAA